MLNTTKQQPAETTTCPPWCERDEDDHHGGGVDRYHHSDTRSVPAASGRIEARLTQCCGVDGERFADLVLVVVDDTPYSLDEARRFARLIGDACDRAEGKR